MGLELTQDLLSAEIFCAYTARLVLSLCGGRCYLFLLSVVYIL